MTRPMKLALGGLLAATCAAQAPQGISYQAVLRDGSGGLRRVRGVDHFKGLGHLGDVLFRQKHEGEKDGLHG